MHAGQGMGRALIVPAVVVALVIGWYLAFTFRHVVVAGHTGGVYIVDRWTGRVEFCTPMSCTFLSRLDDAPFAR